MQQHATSARPERSTPLVVHNGVLALSGYGVRITVDRGHLIVSARDRGEHVVARLARPTARLQRLVVLGHSGLISLDALKWLHGIGASFVQIDADGTVIAASAPLGRDDPGSRRSQALAASNSIGLAITRELLRRKLDGQAAVLNSLAGSDSAIRTIVAASENLTNATSGDELRLLEAAAAQAYWNAWSGRETQFVPRDAPLVPQHWRRYDNRASPLSGSPRRAATPLNALMNYVYALLETECRIALLAVGLDPGIGILHTDQTARDSLALDVMEAVRPVVDERILDLVSSRKFARREFVETAAGDCRLAAPLPEQLLSFLPVIRSHVAPVAEWVARALTKGGANVRQRLVPTPLTQANRSAGRDELRRRQKRSGVSTPTVPFVCQDCGVELMSRRQRFCDTCRTVRRDNQVVIAGTSGLQALARLRSEGADPTATNEARSRLGAGNSARRREAREWEQANPMPSLEAFAIEILPGLQRVPLSAIERATGLSVRQSSRIRQGSSIPHPRHWPALRTLTLS